MLHGNRQQSHFNPAEIKDKEAVYQWCFHSETTKYHSGPPSYPNAPIATEAEFLRTIKSITLLVPNRKMAEAF